MRTEIKRVIGGGLLLMAGMASPVLATGVVFSDGFESYVPGVLDKNQATANPAPNGSGQPWWGPGSPNMTVVSGVQGGVSPHSGTQMLRGGATSGETTLEWNNIAYRENGGAAFSGNLVYSFWFYDPNGAANGANYEDNSAIAYYAGAPSTTDYPASGTLSNSSPIDRLSLGASNFKVNTAGFPETYNSTEYQARVVNAQGGYNSVGWFNLPLTRSVGWHEGEVTIGPADPITHANVVSFYIDNLTTPLLTKTTVIDMGYNTMEFVSEGTSVGYFDDATLSVVPEPTMAVGVAVMAGGMLLRRRGMVRK